jgi:deoxyribodipyrimidine photo-lyase
MDTPLFVVWFKKDLRWHDHAALSSAAASALESGGAVLPLWVYEPTMWQQSDMAAQHAGFANECLREVDAWIRQDSVGNAQLVRMHGEMVDVLAALHAALGVFTLVSTEETGNMWSYTRDVAVVNWCQANGIQWREFPSNGVVRRLLSHGGGRNHWTRHRLQRLQASLLPSPEHVRWHGAKALTGLQLCGEMTAADLQLTDAEKPGRKRGGRSLALMELNTFLNDRGRTYRFDMSSPVTAPESCSRISAQLAWGTLSIRECVHAVATRRTQLQMLPADQRPDGFLPSLKSFESRLHWHCHFIQKLESEPAIELRNVNRGFDNLRNEGELTAEEGLRLQAWCEGRTGFPFIDACMRSLNATGWINFRMRAMLVSFGAYQLWLHWRHLGTHLAQQFTDYEPGIHWSQCQMQSGVTGINTIRIYSPTKQSHDQDPTGVFIRKWVGELSGIAPEFIHEPWLMPQPPGNYPAPIVDLKTATLAAREKIYGKKAEKAVQSEAARVYEKHGSRSPNRETVRPRKTAAVVSAKSKVTSGKSLDPALEPPQLGFEF